MGKITYISLGDDLVNLLKRLPRTISIADFIRWCIKATLYEIKLGRELSAKELQEWIDSTEEGREFRRLLVEKWGDKLEKIAFLDGVNKKRK